MKYLVLIVFIICLKGFGQNMYLTVLGSSKEETKIIDSVGYLRKLVSEKLVFAEIEILNDRLQKMGYLESAIQENTKLNDSVREIKIDLKNQIKKCELYIGIKKNDDLDFENIKKDTARIAFSELLGFLEKKRNQLEKEGYSLAKITLTAINQKEKLFCANLNITLDQIRKINGIEVKGLSNFPKGHLKNLERNYKSKKFTKEELERLKQEVDQYEFVKQIKYPEFLFTKDSTKVFLYLEKKESNTFDGFVGFGNDETTQKIRFTGFLDLNLRNILKSGEKIGLLWKSDGKDQKTLSVGLELPYLHKSPIGIKTNLNLFRQDSLFQNTKIGLEIGYSLFSKSKIYLGYQTETSSVLKTDSLFELNDYKNKFITTSFELSSNLTRQTLLREKNNLSFKIGFGNRRSDNIIISQILTLLTFKKSIPLNSKSNIEIKSQNYLLKSNKFIKNELYRYGGINSIRGFNENSLQGNFFTSVLTEYQYLLAPALLLNTILDYGIYEDRTNSTSGKLLGLGFGLKILTKNGLLNLIYANGTTENQAVKLSNSIIHISLKTNF